jgi:hypothetical protein
VSQLGILLLALAGIAILGSESCKTHDHIPFSHDSGSCVAVLRPDCLPVHPSSHPADELLLALISRIILGSESHRSHYHILLSHNSGLSLSLSLMLRLTVSRPVCLGIKHTSWAYDQILFPFGIWNTSDSYVLDSVGRPL